MLTCMEDLEKLRLSLHVSHTGGAPFLQGLFEYTIRDRTASIR